MKKKLITPKGEIGYSQCSTCGAKNNACGCPIIITGNHQPDTGIPIITKKEKEKIYQCLNQRHKETGLKFPCERCREYIK